MNKKSMKKISFKNIGLIIKKDLDKIFKFPRMIFSTLIMPGLIIFLVYGVLGTSFDSIQKNTEEHTPVVYEMNKVDSIDTVLNTIGIKPIVDNEKTIDEIKDLIENKEVDLLIVYDENFENKVNENAKPKCDLYYSSINNNSLAIYTTVAEILQQYNAQKLVEKGIDVELFKMNSIKTNSENQEAGYFLSSLMPMLLIIMIFAAALGIGCDAIAGEKERGTLSTILMTPIKRSELLTGKLISTVILTLLSAISSFVGVIASLPFNSNLFNLGDISNLSYGFKDFMFLFITLIIVALFASLLLLIISTLTKSTKEATSYGAPVYIIAMVCSMMTMFSNGDEGISCYMIPIYNTSLILKSLFSMSLDMTNFLVMLGSTLVFSVLAIIILQTLFKKESIAFGK